MYFCLIDLFELNPFLSAGDVIMTSCQHNKLRQRLLLAQHRNNASLTHPCTDGVVHGVHMGLWRKECVQLIADILSFFFFWYSAVQCSQQQVNDSHHLAGGSWRRRTTATVARHLRSSHWWESRLGKIAEVVSRCLPRGFYFRVTEYWAHTVIL